MSSLDANGPGFSWLNCYVGIGTPPECYTHRNGHMGVEMNYDECIEKIRELTEKRDELLKSTELLLAVIDRQVPSLEGMMELLDARTTLAKIRGEQGMKLSGKMVEIPIEKFYKFAPPAHEGKYAVRVDTEAKYGYC